MEHNDEQGPAEVGGGEEDPTRKAKMAEPARGLPKSGRWWKQTQKHRHSGIVKVPSLKSTWKEKMQQRATDKIVKAKQAEIREAITEKKTARAKERKEREERRKANERKGEVVQAIRNSNKLRRAKKKQLRNVEMRDTSGMQ